jgi:hypothetical protein
MREEDGKGVSPLSPLARFPVFLLSTGKHLILASRDREIPGEETELYLCLPSGNRLTLSSQ